MADDWTYNPELDGPTVDPDQRGCYGWPRACEHEDDGDCMEAEGTDFFGRPTERTT